MGVKYILTFKDNYVLNFNDSRKLSTENSNEICDIIKIRISELIKQRRENLGYTVEKLSRLSDVGVTSIKSFEKGTKLPCLEVLFKLSYPLKIKYGDILRCFAIEDTLAECRDSYLTSLKKGDVIGIYSSSKKAEETITNFARAYKNLQEDNFDIREIIWD